MRCGLLLSVLVVTSCTDEPAAPEPAKDLFDAVWPESIRPGDVIVVVPGTGAVSGLGPRIEKSGELVARDHIVWVDPIEAAVAAAQRAGLTNEELEGGAITFALWGAGVDGLDHFTYTSADNLRIPFDVIGGATVCGVGDVAANLTNYSGSNADKDARDLYLRTQTYLAAHPGTPDRKLTLVSHSWGGIVSQYFASNLAALVHDHGALDAAPTFVVAAGVPGVVPGFIPHGSGFRTIDSKTDGSSAAIKSYEDDRPDDPVHSFNPSGYVNGHHYIIMFGDEYRGFYGITTDELSCGNVAGPCPG